MCSIWPCTHEDSIQALCQTFCDKVCPVFCSCSSYLILNLVEGCGHWQSVKLILQKVPQEKIKDGSNLEVVEARKWIPFSKSTHTAGCLRMVSPHCGYVVAPCHVGTEYLICPEVCGGINQNYDLSW